MIQSCWLTDESTICSDNKENYRSINVSQNFMTLFGWGFFISVLYILMRMCQSHTEWCPICRCFQATMSSFAPLCLILAASYVRFSHSGRVISGDFPIPQDREHMYMIWSGKFLKIWLLMFYGFLGLLSLGYIILFSVCCCSNYEKTEDYAQFMLRLSGGPPEDT